ncbi:MAG: hypothetical protein MZV64_35295 [Ignavibacteriales bacterium]|nr:hypothetical protein [Ignavibacteriales bacterium]
MYIHTNGDKNKTTALINKPTLFIIHFYLKNLLKEIDKRFKSEKDFDLYFNYTINRWYNFWSAQAVENIFCSLPNVKPALDSKDRLVDFTINGVSFDHKTSIFPKNFPYKIDEAIKKTDELIKWLYKNQSQAAKKTFKEQIIYCSLFKRWRTLEVEIRNYVA